MAEKIVVYWRDIPSQVNIKRGRVKGKALLSARFQEAIDKAAIRAGKAGPDEYIAEWRRVTSDCDCEGDLDEFARQEADALEAAIDPASLDAYVRNKGLKPAA